MVYLKTCLLNARLIYEAKASKISHDKTISGKAPKGLFLPQSGDLSYFVPCFVLSNNFLSVK